MNKEKKFVGGKAILRQKAEALAEKRSQKNESQLSEADIKKLIHELEVHQFELELQNEELELALSAARDAIELYDLAPSGYFTLSGEGEILKLNLAASQMLGKVRSSLLNSNFGFFVSNDTKPIFNQFLTEVLTSNEKTTCELVLLSENEPMFVHLSGIAIENGEQCLITAVDFTERKQAESALGQSEELLSLFLKYSPIYAFIKDVTSTESRVIKASENYVEMIGIRGSEMAGKNMEELFPEEFAAKITADDWAVVSKGEVLKVDEELNGRYYTTIKYPITQGERKLLAGYTIDMTESRELEKALKKSEYEFRMLAEAMPQIVWVTKADGWNVYFNQQWVNYTGQSLEESYGHGWNKPFHPEDQQRARDAWQSATRKGTTYSVESRLRRADGVYNWWLIRGVPVLDENGHILKWFGTCTDINELKCIEANLRDSEHRYRLLIENANEGILVAQGPFIRFVNPMMMKITGFTEEELITLHFMDFIHQDDKELVLKNYTNRLKGEYVDDRYQFRLIRKDTCVKWVEICGVRIEWEGKPATLNFLTDITERKASEHEIKLQNEVLSKLVAEKDKFFSLIAHDLRSPFNVFLGFTQMLDEGVSTMERAKIQKIVGLLRNTALDVFDLLENLLEWSRIERGIISYEPHSVLLLKQLEESLQSVYESANKKGIEISIDIPDNLAVFADTNMLRSILRNLASNAVKFTPKFGNIIVSACAPTIHSVEIAMKDSGIGMDEDMIGKLFFLNEQINRKGTEGEPSSGLGLFICKEFVEKHGGKIRVESSVGNGTTFYFTIPYENSSIN